MQTKAIDSAELRLQLARVLRSRIFERAQRSQRFLRYLVEAALADPPVTVKEYTIAMEVFDRGVDYDPSVDATVRVEASRLRSRLREYYAEEGRDDPWLIQIPKGAYGMVFTPRASEELPSARDSREAPASKKRGRLAALLAVASATAIVAAAVVLKFWLTANSKVQPELRVTPFTSYAGDEATPSFAPDGNRVVFAWRQPKENSFQLFVKQIGSGDPVRLTDGPDVSPQWSPDGNYIAFFRQTKDRDRPALMIVPALGGQPRQLATISVRGLWVITAPWQCWSADSKWLFVGTASENRPTTELVRISVDTGELQRVLAPADNTSGDGSLTMSPDGRTLAFVRTVTWDICDIYLLAVSNRQDALGAPRRVTFDGKRIEGLAWTADGRELVFSSNRGASGMMELWRVAAFGPPHPARVVGVPDQIEAVAMSRQAEHLVFARLTQESHIWRKPLGSNGSGRLAPFVSSTRFEDSPQYSPDGKRIAFNSDRSGTEEIWVANADGTNALQLTSIGAWTGSPRWSWDGERIAFDSNRGGSFNIYVVNANGGRPLRLTTDGANNVRPSWSHDGKWIFYNSRRGGRSQIWKITPTGTTNIQMTKKGSDITALVSADGEDVYYAKDGGLWKVPVQGGQETKVLPSVCDQCFTPSKHGIYFATCSNGTETVSYMEFRRRSIKGLSKDLTGTCPMAASPDERWLLVCKGDSASDLMLAQNFH